MHTGPTILVAGVVPGLDRLRSLASVRRAQWKAVVRESLRPGVDLAIIGASPADIDARAVIGDLRRAPEASVPVLHLVSHGAACHCCGADVCLPAEARPDTLAGVVRVLLNVGRTRHGPAPVDTPHPIQEAAKRGATSLLFGLVQAVPGVVFVYDLSERRVTYASASVETVLGRTASEVEARGVPADLVHPEDLASFCAAHGDATARGDGPFEGELRARAKDGRWRILRARAVVIARDGEKAEQILCVATDATAEHETRRMLERAQRLEVLGRLVGGIAHDFNNLLGVITGHGQLVQRLLPRDHPACAGLEQVVKASERAAALTQQLLAFGRPPTREPLPLEIDTVVSEFSTMLHRVIAEDVELDVCPGAVPGAVRAERSEIEQILLNLAVNARDAMPAGGRLAIATRKADLEALDAAGLGVEPGPYVVLEVSDTGTGMDAETRRRIFEPFFTTKPEGVGSGLGLATVHGIVQRAGGAISVDTEQGTGTRFRIYLPRVASPADQKRAALVPGEVPGGGETILLVEDADLVREVTRELLEGLGYTVLPASHGAQALALARAYPGPIHLLFTDVVMPQLDGASLAAQVASVRPQIRVLYMSGYDELPEQEGVRERTLLLRKPFTRGRLGEAIRQTLDG